MKEFKFYIPIKGNDGNAFSEKNFQDFESDLLQAFSGFSFSGEITGKWQSGGIVYSDISRVYFIACPDISAIYSILEKWNSVFRQLSYFVSLVSSEISFYEPKQKAV